MADIHAGLRPGGRRQVQPIVHRARTQGPDGRTRTEPKRHGCPAAGTTSARATRAGTSVTLTAESQCTEAAVRFAIDWLARHQSSDGSWSLKNYVQRCKDATCSGPGNVDADAAATAMGLLPFLAHGETHKTGGRRTIARYAAGLLWLLRRQKPNGDLSAGSPQQMYAHALATIALCEATA